MKKLALVLLALVWGIFSAYGQYSIVLTGQVLDTNEMPVAGVIVNAYYAYDQQYFAQDYTDDAGYFLFSINVPTDTGAIVLYAFTQDSCSVPPIQMEYFSGTDTIDFGTLILTCGEVPTPCTPYFYYEQEDPMSLTFNFYLNMDELPVKSPEQIEIDFGDGNVGNFDANGFATHTYADTGTYVVTATNYNSDCDTNSFSLVLYAYTIPDTISCYAAFDYYYIDSTDYHTVLFDNFSYPEDAQFTWDFGDGTTSEEFSPIHTYSEDGEYWVSLTVATENCMSYLMLPVWIYNEDSIWFGGSEDCEALFYTEYLDSLTVAFYDISWAGLDDSIVSYFWDFGDGNTSILANPIYTYSDTGTYLVSLTIQTTSGCMSSFEEYVYIGSALTDSAWYLFYPQYEGTGKGHKVKFYNLSRSGSDMSWDFGDAKGATAKGNTVTHIYDNTGQYTVTMTPVDNPYVGYKMDINVTDNDVEILKGYAFRSNAPANVDNAKFFNLTIYPNPVKDNINIVLDGRKANISILSVDGKLITSQTFENSKIANIDVAQLPSGVYLIKVEADNQVYTAKFVK